MFMLTLLTWGRNCGRVVDILTDKNTNVILWRFYWF